MSKATPPDPKSRASLAGTALRMAVRVAVIGAVAYVAHRLIAVAMTLADQLPTAGAEAMVTAMLMTALLVYALLIAIPFVPGAEIGLALLLLRGASIAPAVYTATLLGLSLAFLIGRLLPEASIVRLLSDLRLRRAAALVAGQAGLPPAERLARLEARLPKRFARPMLRYRYLCLGLLLNLPGNVFLGGGGGLMMLAGLSRLYLPRQTLVAIAIAVLPVPLMIWWLGPALLA